MNLSSNSRKARSKAGLTAFTRLYWVLRFAQDDESEASGDNAYAWI